MSRPCPYEHDASVISYKPDRFRTMLIENNPSCNQYTNDQYTNDQRQRSGCI